MLTYGCIDNSFGSNGVTITSIRAIDDDNFLDIIVKQDGNIVFIGNECGGSFRYLSAHYTASEIVAFM